MKKSFKETFPEIETAEVELKFVMDGRTIILKDDKIQDYPCSNPVCENGGYDIPTEILKMVHSKETEKEGIIKCRGREKMGHKITRECGKYAEFKIKIKYKKQ